MRTKQTPVPARGLSDEDSDSEGDLEALEAWQGPAPIDSGGDSGRAHGAAPPQSGADGASPCAAVQQMGAHDGGEPGSAAAAEAEVEAEGEADACAAADAETEAVGIAWPMFQEFAVRGSHPPSIAVPLDMMRTCFPGAELPLEMRLRLEVDGHPWGQPFPSRINPSGHIAAGLRSFPELFGCRVIGLRRDTDSGGAAALTLLLSSLEDERHGDDERPVAVRITEYVSSSRILSVKKDMVQACTITSIRRLSPSSIELRASTAAVPGGGGAGVRTAGARARPAGVGVKRRQPQQEREDSGSEEETCSSGGEGAEEGSKEGIDPPPGGDALAEAGCTAMLEAQRAAEALGLEPALFAAVCRGMQQATEGTVGARRFLAGDYPSLRYACGAGDVAVAREWMVRMAARGGGSGGGGSRGR
ncbi:hypothetical protein Rsub_04621 [Raphidocelis subcapitata]|uniref:Uncharacterized protein n=1 Tax=Raphidocelis subcapitata TaxID=307507 RepID=A0A2V0P5R7_9CHLO|nr:hypothetical protein Rsub_04621 [Raphidocelis subcapitata]|eukprot:GBF92517.1 hypothetical protein Rsub_04621 [Raphidocelis subcapitata]